MAHTTVWLVVLLACAGASAHRLQADAQSAHSRRLLKAATSAAATSANQCEWNMASNSCEAADAVDIMYAVRGQPLSPYLWFLMMTHDRKHVCEEYSTRNSCRSDKAHNCVWLDDILGDDSSSSKGKQPAAKTVSAERASGAVPNLFTARMAALQKEFGASLRELLGRSQTPLVNPAMELMAGDVKPAANTPAAAAAPSSSKSSPSSSGGGGKKAQLKCTSRELIENFVYTESGYSSVLQAPLAMHCPGSKAFELVRCMGQPSNAACSSIPGCVVVPRVVTKGSADLCVSQHFNKLSKDQMNQFMVGLTLAEPAVVGSCDGACWMRQSLLCNHTKGADDCSSLSFCRSMGDTCVPKLYTQDDFGSTVQEYLGECHEVDSRQQCERKTIKLVNKGRYAQWSMPTRNIAECNVPSVRGMLGRVSTVAKEGAARLEMLTMMGAETEKQAAALAAATAAADAAKAGRILAERGVTGLQQLYSSASTILG
jgi:hypothetical protein